MSGDQVPRIPDSSVEIDVKVEITVCHPSIIERCRKSKTKLRRSKKRKNCLGA